MRRCAVLGQLMLCVTACGPSPLAAEAPETDVELSVATFRRSEPATPTVLATAPDQDSLSGLFAADGDVYFTGSRVVPRSSNTPGPPFETLGVLRRVSSAGGTVDELWSGAGGGSDVAVGAAAIYFLTYDFYWRTGHLNRVPKTGGAAVELGTWGSHGSSHSLAFQGSSAGDLALWTHSAGAGSFVNRTAGADGTTVTLADSSTIGSSADDIVVKDGFVYWFSSLTGPTVFGVSADGGTPFEVFQAPDITALAAAQNDDSLYVGAGGRLLRIDLGALGGRKGRPRELASGPERITAIAATDRTVYFGTWNADAGTGAVTKLRRHGGSPMVITSGPINPVAVALDGTSVYWVDTLGRTLSRAPQ